MPGRQRDELWLAQDGGERRDGEVQVAELLHVEIDEDALVRRGAVQNAQLGAHARQRAVQVDRHELAHDRGEFDRDVGDLATRHHLDDAAEAVGSLDLSEHRLAQDVHVGPEPLASPTLEVAGQRRRVGVEDQVAGERTDASVHRGDHQSREQSRRQGRRAQAREVPDSEPLARRVRDRLAQRRRGAPARGEAHDLVGQRHRHAERGAVTQEPGESAARRAFAPAQVPRRVLEQDARSTRGRLDEAVEGGIGRRQGHEGGSPVRPATSCTTTTGFTPENDPSSFLLPGHHSLSGRPRRALRRRATQPRSGPG